MAPRVWEQWLEHALQALQEQHLLRSLRPVSQHATGNGALVGHPQCSPIDYLRHSTSASPLMEQLGHQVDASKHQCSHHKDHPFDHTYQPVGDTVHAVGDTGHAVGVHAPPPSLLRRSTPHPSPSTLLPSCSAPHPSPATLLNRRSTPHPSPPCVAISGAARPTVEDELDGAATIYSTPAAPVHCLGHAASSTVSVAVSDAVLRDWLESADVTGTESHYGIQPSSRTSPRIAPAPLTSPATGTASTADHMVEEPLRIDISTGCRPSPVSGSDPDPVSGSDHGLVGGVVGRGICATAHNPHGSSADVSSGHATPRAWSGLDHNPHLEHHPHLENHRSLEKHLSTASPHVMPEPHSGGRLSPQSHWPSSDTALLAPPALTHSAALDRTLPVPPAQSRLPSPGSTLVPPTPATPTANGLHPAGYHLLRLFSGNDYLGLSGHPKVRAAAAQAALEFGMGPRASPLVCGYTTHHRQLEIALARLKGTEDCLLLPTGFAANLAAITAACATSPVPSPLGHDVALFSDALNHASIIDGVRLAQAGRQASRRIGSVRQRDGSGDRLGEDCRTHPEGCWRQDRGWLDQDKAGTGHDDSSGMHPCICTRGDLCSGRHDVSRVRPSGERCDFSGGNICSRSRDCGSSRQDYSRIRENTRWRQDTVDSVTGAGGGGDAETAGSTRGRAGSSDGGRGEGDGGRSGGRGEGDGGRDGGRGEGDGGRRDADEKLFGGRRSGSGGGGVTSSVYRHCDMQHLEELLTSSRATRKVVITDSLFSMDGDYAPLLELVALRRRFGFLLIVDEAHATLICGPSGGGVAQACRVEHQVDLHVGTLSKAVGCHGGFIACSRRWKRWILSRGRSFVFSTAQPIPTVAAAVAALQVAEEEPWRRELLWRHVARFSRAMGVAFSSPIAPLVVGGAKEALEASSRLLLAGFHVPAIRPPTVPADSSRLRITFSAAHSPADVEALIAALPGCLGEDTHRVTLLTRTLLGSCEVANSGLSGEGRGEQRRKRGRAQSGQGAGPQSVDGGDGNRACGGDGVLVDTHSRAVQGAASYVGHPMADVGAMSETSGGPRRPLLNSKL